MTDLFFGVNTYMNYILLYCLGYGIFKARIDGVHELTILKQKQKFKKIKIIILIIIIYH